MGKKNICSLSDITCTTPYKCTDCQIKKAYDLGFETLNNPTKNGNYLCRCQFYKDKNDIVETEIEWYDEWKITDTWNILGWKKLEK